MPIINNIGSLKNDLENNGWHMTAFQFNYNGVYDVLFENNEDFEKRKNPYASVTLTFIDTYSDNSNDELTDIQIINKFIEREKNYR